MAIRSAPPARIGAATALAFLAGTVDAVGYSLLGGLFVSFMSGNSTRLGVSLAVQDGAKAAQIAAIILAFVVGAGLGSALARWRARPRPVAVLLLEAALLSLAALACQAGLAATGSWLMSAAMGVENATFADGSGETRVNLTFMTGALVKLGEGVAAACFGGPRWAWWPHLALWLSLTSGATVGAWSYAKVGTLVLPFVSAAVLGIALLFAASERRCRD